jgi:hypothetical protein
VRSPHLWIDRSGGFHLLTHDQNNHAIHATRGAYGWSQNGSSGSWTLETGPLLSNSSAWPQDLAWANGSRSALARRQRPSLIRDPTTGAATHVMQGADLHAHHPSPASDLESGFCDGCHWGSGFTLIQPLGGGGGGKKDGR